jgi:hypothetical protein
MLSVDENGHPETGLVCPRVQALAQMHAPNPSPGNAAMWLWLSEKRVDFTFASSFEDGLRPGNEAAIYNLL